MSEKNGYDGMADAHRKIEELRLEMHEKEGVPPEHVGKIVAGAVAEHGEKLRQQMAEEMEKHRQEMHEHMRAEGERRDNELRAHMDRHYAQQGEMLKALQDIAKSRTDDYEVHRTGTVETPTGAHKMDVTEVHRRRK